MPSIVKASQEVADERLRQLLACMERWLVAPG